MAEGSVAKSGNDVSTPSITSKLGGAVTVSHYDVIAE